MSALSTFISTLAADLLARLLDRERAMQKLDERLQILEARREADRRARAKFGSEQKKD